MKLGAFHFANKPFNLDEVARPWNGRSKRRGLRREVRQDRTSAARPTACRVSSASLRRWRPCGRWSRKVATSPVSTVLLTGESGTGKDLDCQSDPLLQPPSVAAVHEHYVFSIAGTAARERTLRPRARRFHRSGAQERGLLESANGGTLFLDEVGEMSPALQAKLLRVLEEWRGHAHRRRRATASTCASSRPRTGISGPGRQRCVRSDLYFRLNVLPIPLPALRDHAEDIPLLTDVFIDSVQS